MSGNSQGWREKSFVGLDGFKEQDLPLRIATGRNLDRWHGHIQCRRCRDGDGRGHNLLYSQMRNMGKLSVTYPAGAAEGGSSGRTRSLAWHDHARAQPLQEQTRRSVQAAMAMAMAKAI